MSEREEVLLEPGYVLHQRPYRNTSMIIDCLTGHYGRQTLVAQGARRPESRQKSLLQPFSRLRLSWVRRGELGRLTHVEADHPVRQLTGEALLAAYYVNELLLRLVPGSDPSEPVLSCYSSCLDRLAESGQVARALRLFELALLDALGVGLDLSSDCRTGEPIEPGRDYRFEHEGGLTVVVPGSDVTAYSGDHLVSLREHRLEDPPSLRAARSLLGSILKFHLGDRPLKTRQVARELIDFGLS